MTDQLPTDHDEAADAVVLAYVHSDQVASSWHHSILEAIADDFAGEGRIVRGGFIAIHCGTGGLVEARNLTAKTFLREKNADWLWITDTDMGFAPDTLTRLLEAADPVERPIVGALCFAQRELDSDGIGGYVTAATPTVYDWGNLNGQQGYLVRYDYPANTLIQCGGTGSACLVIHRSVFEKIEAEHGPVWYDRVPNTSTGQLISEDLSFCLRAGALKIPVFVHTGIRCSHLKPVWLSEREYTVQRVADVAARKSHGRDHHDKALAMLAGAATVTRGE